ncbi:hypothetical protein ARMGADRAFT_1111961 [Armillaria gallica]|uniref:Uncharacterized protein n=1 Tax=Armillaria gallica TaxID=47427 RepID=A0A2H3DI89_ARMGA|nr:hypothetical protein ARMGADRAFT_1111961 [Armillaria gallica]
MFFVYHVHCLLIPLLRILCMLVFNNLMVVGVTKIPWFSYGGLLPCFDFELYP